MAQTHSNKQIKQRKGTAENSILLIFVRWKVRSENIFSFANRIRIRNDEPIIELTRVKSRLVWLPNVTDTAARSALRRGCTSGGLPVAFSRVFSHLASARSTSRRRPASLTTIASWRWSRRGIAGWQSRRATDRKTVSARLFISSRHLPHLYMGRWTFFRCRLICRVVQRDSIYIWWMF